MRTATIVLAILLLSPTPDILGQSSVLPPGSRVRVTLPCSAIPAAESRPVRADCATEGSLLRLTDDSVMMDGGEATLSVARNQVSRLEVSQGQRSHWKAGAGIGSLAGAGFTYLLVDAGGSTSLCDRSANQDALSSTECLGLTVLGGVTGAGLGAVIGNLVKSERWESFPIEDLRVGLISGPNFGLRVLF